MKSSTVKTGRSRSLNLADRPLTPLESSLAMRSSLLEKREQARASRLQWESMQGSKTRQRRREE
jgi:hypothetical protein